MYSLRDLLDLFKSGDSFAFECIFLEYSPKVYRFAIRYISNKEDAEEIVQDVFIRLWNARKSVDTSLNFDNYLFTITRNLIFNRHRDKINDQHLKAAILASFEQEYYLPEDDIISQDLSYHIERIVGLLPPKQQEVFNMSRKQMLTHKEIGEQLGISEKTVKAHIYQAISKIRKCLENLDIKFYFF